jgi:peptidoglycan hydrolase-like protein with peptidoglycan-binding domain
VAGAVVLAAAVATGGVVVASGSQDDSGTTPEPAISTQAVQRGTLAAVVALHGTLTHRARPDGSPYAAINRASGTYTALPDVGDRVDCGDVLYRVDDEPVLLLCGPVPAYRDLAVGSAGRDVRQLNRNLHRLGYDRRAAVRIDPDADEFTAATQAALARLQRAKGVDATGSLDTRDAVVLPRSARIAKVGGELGGAARTGGRVLQATSDALEVQVRLDATQRRDVRRGAAARITLPGNRIVRGTVDRIGTVAETAHEDDDVGSATVPGFVTLDRPQQARGLDRAPVRVEVTTEGVKDALSVPVIALVGRSGGGFAVERVGDGGRRDLVAVELGLFDTASGRVQVTGELAEGDRVAVPAS